MKKLLLLLIAAVPFLAAGLRAQSVDGSNVVEVKVFGSAGSNTIYDGDVASFEVGDGLISGSSDVAQGTIQTSVATEAWTPGVKYTILGQGQNIGWATLSLVPPPGYTALVNGVEKESVQLSVDSYGNISPIEVCIVGPGQFNGRAGACTSLINGQIYWQVALGSLKDGNPAGAIVLADPGLGPWNTIATTLSLNYLPTSAEVSAYTDSSGNLRQILADQADVDIVTLADGSFELRFYNPSQLQGTSYPYSFSGLPYVAYHVSGTTNPGISTIANGDLQTNTLTITSVTHLASQLSSGSLSGNLPDPANTAVARTAQTVETMTRTWGESLPNGYVWTLNDWNSVGESQIATETRTWSGTFDNPTEVRTVSTGSGTPVLTVAKAFSQNLGFFGEQLTSISWGSDQHLASTYAYYTDTTSPNNLGFPQSVSSTDGSWHGYDYSTTQIGVLADTCSPFNGSPSSFTPGSPAGRVTTLQYGLDAFQMPTRVTSMVTSINGTVINSEATTYSQDSTDAQVNGCSIVVATRTDTPGANTSGTIPSNGSPLQTVSKYYREDSPDDFYCNQPYSVANPDGTMEDYAYARGSLSFDPNASSADASYVADIKGVWNNAGTGTLANSFGNGCTIDNIYLIDGKSTAQVTVRNSQALVTRVESYAWVGGAWQEVACQTNTYDQAGMLLTSTSLNGIGTSSTYAGDQKLTDVDEAGVTTTYGYDAAGRVSTIAKSTGSTTTFAYDAAGRVLSETMTGATDSLQTVHTYDDAGRVTSETPPGLGVTQFAYSYNGYASSGWSRTTTLPDGNTKIENYQSDGSLSSIGGTGVVAESFAYSVDGNGNLLTQTCYGPGTTRWTQTLTDGLGRSLQASRPVYLGPGSSTFTQSNVYSTTTGQLIETDRTGYAPMRYVYDVMGNVTESGLDLDPSGGGQLVLASADRIVGHDQYVEYYNGGYWLHEQTTTYPWTGSNASNPLVTSIVRKCLTGLPSGRLEQVQSTDSYGNVTTSTVDVSPGAGTVTKTVTPPGVANSAIETTTYESSGTQVQTTTVDGLTFSVNYDPYGRETSATDSRGNVTHFTSIAGTTLASTVEDASSAITQYAYDSLGRVTQVVDPSGTSTYRNYTALGEVNQQWGGGTYPVSYGYDAYGVRTQLTTYQGGSGWNSGSWPSASGTGNTTTWNYDPASGMLVSKQDAAGAGASFTYNIRGQTATRTWARTPTSITTYSYYGDASGDPDTGELKNVSYNDTVTAPIGYSYTRSGQVAAVTDATGTRTFAYDANQPLQLDSVALDSSFYSGRVLTRLYNSDGLLPGRPTGFQLGNGGNPSADLEQDHYYNNLGRFDHLTSSVQSGAQSTTFNYGYLTNTEMINSVWVSGSNFQVTRSYESLRNVLSGIATLWGGASPVTYCQFNYTRNSLQQIEYAQQQGSAFADATGSGGSLYNAYSYDGVGEVTQAAMYRNSPPSGSNSPSPSNQLPGRQFYYQYDNTGNRIQAGPAAYPNAVNTAYTTNNLNQYTQIETNTQRVIGDTASGATVTIAGTPVNTLDRSFGATLANNLSSSPTYNSVAVTGTLGTSTISLISNYLLAPQPQHLTYDADGNLLSDGIWNYTYDGENRICEMQSALPGLGGMPTQINYYYDYLGRRVEKVVQPASGASVTKRFIYDGWDLIAETDSSGNLQRSYTWGLDLGGSLTASGGVGALLNLTNFSTGTPVSYFAGSDGNGNVSVLINAATGALAAAYEYSPFGEPMRNNAFDSAVADNPIRFSSKYTDVESGLVYYGARYYSPTLGRFINRDPIEEGGGINLYGFCGNDGVSAFDYLGYSFFGNIFHDIGKIFSDIGHAIAKAWDKFHNTIITAVLYAIPGIGPILGTLYNIGVGAYYGGASGAILAAVGSGVIGSLPALMESGYSLYKQFQHGKFLNNLGNWLENYAVGSAAGAVTNGVEQEMKGGSFASGFTDSLRAQWDGIKNMAADTQHFLDTGHWQTASIFFGKLTSLDDPTLNESGGGEQDQISYESPAEAAAWLRASAASEAIYELEHPSFTRALGESFGQLSGALNMGARIGEAVPWVAGAAVGGAAVGDGIAAVGQAAEGVAGNATTGAVNTWWGGAEGLEAAQASGGNILTVSSEAEAAAAAGDYSLVVQESQAAAQAASGAQQAYLGSTGGSIFLGTELPALLANPAVTTIEITF